MGIFDPIWKTDKSEKEDKAIAAVRKISDPQKLKEIALTAPLHGVIKAAIKGISDQKTLFEILITASDYYRRSVALEGISDQRMLYEILQVLSGWQDMNMMFILTHDVCRKLTDQSLLRQAALEGFGNADDIVKKISDPKVLVEIASHSHSSSMRCKAVELIKDPDALLSFMSDSLDADIRRTAQNKLSDRFIQRYRSDKTLHLTDDQMTRYVDALIAETDERIECCYLYDLDEDSMRRIRRDARRTSLRAYALGCMVRALPDAQLLEAYKEALTYETYENKNLLPDRNGREAVDMIERRVCETESHNTMLQMDFIRDADTGCNMVAQCIHVLFDKTKDSLDGIETLREEAVETFIQNIPAYMGTGYNEYYCFDRLTYAIPPEALEKYGFEVNEFESKEEDYAYKYITYKGRIIS